MNRLASTDSDDVELVVRDTGDTIRHWTQYSYNQDFTTATDAFALTIGGRDYVKEYWGKLRPGSLVSLVINGKVQCTGYIDRRQRKPTRDGTTLEITGRDSISPLVDSGVDPLYQFTTKSTLNDVFQKVARPFGITVVSTTDIANRSVITGYLAKNVRKQYGPPTRVDESIGRGATVTDNTVAKTLTNPPTVIAEYDPTKPKFLKDFAIDQMKPHSGEGCYEFLSRLAKRFHLGVWSNSTGDQIIVDAPNFDQAPIFSLRRQGGATNFVDLDYAEDATDQATVIFGTGIGANMVNSYTKLKLIKLNELTGCDPAGNILPEVRNLIQAVGRQGFTVMPIRKQICGYSVNFLAKHPRPQFIHDEESHTFGQLEGFLTVEMAKLQAKAMQLNGTVKGHTQNGVPWCVNTMVSVWDDELELYGNYWIKSRTFKKSRQGTTTDLVLIPPYTMMFS